MSLGFLVVLCCSRSSPDFMRLCSISLAVLRGASLPAAAGEHAHLSSRGLWPPAPQSSREC